MKQLKFSNICISKEYTPNNWSESHLSCPSPIHIKESSIIRVYYTSISSDNKGYISYYDVDENDPTKIVYEHDQPVLSYGMKGTFDDNGVFCVSIIRRDEQFELYYIGFELSDKIRYKIFTGCATSKDGINFKRVSTTPLLDRVKGQEYFRGGPFVYRKDNQYKMLYIGGGSWVTTPMGEKPEYNIFEVSEISKFKYTDYEPVKMFDYKLDQHGFGRPVSYTLHNIEYLFYSTRSVETGLYRLDGEVRNSGEAVDFSPLYEATGESELCYFTPISVKNRNFVFFNDGNFGRKKIYVTEII